ncbi:MAG: hypothetical protein KIT58_04170 [Planctomycetota bacterium]|nr:hypothetical protein [Planctomycetota bacterium]
MLIADADPRRLVVKADVERVVPAGIAVEVLSLGKNVGPAASAQAAFEVVLPKLNADDWVMVLDDDEGLPDSDYLARLGLVARSLRLADPHVGGVGRVGHRFNYTTGTLTRPRTSEIVGLVPVDYLSTNHAPMFRVAALRAVSGYRIQLFIGHTEVDLGLRMRRAGFTIYAVAELWKQDGRTPNWRGVTTPVVRAEWRRYYSVRNLVFILKDSGNQMPAVRASARALSKSVLDTLIHPRRGLRGLSYTARGVMDGWRGCMGRTVLPPVR